MQHGPEEQRPLACDLDPALQRMSSESPLNISDSFLNLSSLENNKEFLRDSLSQDGKRPLDVTTVSVNMGNMRGGLASTTFKVKAVEGKIDGASLSGTSAKTLELNTIDDDGEKTSVVQSLSSTVDVAPKTGEYDLLINGSTVNAVGMATSQGQQGSAVMKEVLSSTTEVSGSSEVLGVTNHSLSTGTLDGEGKVSVMQERAVLTSQVSMAEGSAEPNVNGTTTRSVGMSIGTLDKDIKSFNATNVNSAHASVRRPHEGSFVYTDRLLQCQQQIKDLRYQLYRCQSQKGIPAQTRG